MPFTGTLPVKVQEAVADIKQYFGVDNPGILSFDSLHIVIPVTYSVPLPSNGAVNGIDIKPEEPVMIKIKISGHPDSAPYILSDRKNFPKSRLSHLYFSPEGEPGRLCLVRNDPDEWFASIKMVDFLDVGRQWLYKAGTGTLNEDGDEFDPTRVEGNVFFGKHIYKYGMMNDVVLNDERLVPEYPMAICLAGVLTNTDQWLSYKSIKAIPFLALPAFKESVQAFYKKPNDPQTTNSPTFSILVWHPDQKIEDLYFTTYPKNYGQLKTFFIIRGISIENILLALEKAGVLIKCGVPIIYAIKRPKKMIGYNGYYEFFNFVLIMPTDGGVKATLDDAEVFIQGHNEPFSSELAAHISGQDRTLPTLYIGAGSLGSKMIMHDARSGNRNIAAVDNKPLLSHNLARHELFAADISRNKARAIIEQIKAFYTLDLTDNLIAFDRSITSLNDTDIEQYKLIVDTTASVQVKNNLLLRTLPVGSRYCKAEIADDGALGLFYAEGAARNPRMDDLVNLILFLAVSEADLQKWRIADAGRTIKNLDIGLGCSSATSVMADNTLSLHASVFSKIIEKTVKPSNGDSAGLLYLSICREEGELPQIASKKFDVAPFEVLECQAGSGWQIRMRAGMTEIFLALCKKYKPVETGGVLVGMANYKTKVVHVFDLITEPQDSKGTCTGFTRGKKGLPQEIEKVKRATGNVIGYIGEWHTHPMDLRRLSGRDMETIADLKVLNARIPIPTCALIVTPDKVLGFVFEK